MSEASLQTPGGFEEHRDSRQRRDKCRGALSFSFFFFGQAKKKDNPYSASTLTNKSLAIPGLALPPVCFIS